MSSNAILFHFLPFHSSYSLFHFNISIFNLPTIQPKITYKSPNIIPFLCSHLFYKIDSQKQNTIETLNINVDVDMIDDDNTFICL